ncbi:hypothetical protein PRZ48_011025 [Zasmidium cellare]|uniref:Uncharacterized protein n=1 Tax=Zasmidium cellare TaxID=395010 RepID=A0ABR0EAA9_ZASCE|nr:hypothetical protein PRZ48_011025 [Zasmidium cellare]
MVRYRDKKPNYVNWSTEDLITAIENRTGEVVVLFQRKSVYIQRLEAIRRNPGLFRFLDLPAEMRNNVYEELLPARRGTEPRVTHTAILRTSKAMYKEAAQIFYQDSHVNLTIRTNKLHYTNPDKIRKVFPLSRISFEHTFGESIFCLYFRHIQNITVKIEWDWWSEIVGDDRKWHVRELLAFWQILVGKCEDLHTLRVVFERTPGKSRERQKVMLETLAPLRETWNEGRLKLEGLGDRTKQKFVDSCKTGD